MARCCAAVVAGALLGLVIFVGGACWVFQFGSDTIAHF